VDFELGRDYVNKIQSIEPEFLLKNYVSIKNDSIGKPRLYRFSGCGTISPTTLRYISVMLELKKLFKLETPIKVAEIGIGYGGQFAIINEFMNVQSYSAFDLPQVLELSEKFISSVSSTHNFVKKDIYNVESEQFDLLISNYAFSELPIHIQREYVEKIISRAKMGYMIMNSGKTDLTGRSAGKISLSELQYKITGLEVLQEIPLTGPDNYLLVWGR
jgi:putative sugar O-methyltransferase